MPAPAEWRTVTEVRSNTIFDKVKIGDDVAIWQYDADDWATGIVTNIGTYKSRSTRWIERPALTVKLHENGKSRVFYEDCVEQILFKD